MAIEFACECGKRFRLAEEFAGRRVRCPACKRISTVPYEEVYAAEPDSPTGEAKPAEVPPPPVTTRPAVPVDSPVAPPSPSISRQREVGIGATCLVAGIILGAWLTSGRREAPSAISAPAPDGEAIARAARERLRERNRREEEKARRAEEERLRDEEETRTMAAEVLRIVNGKNNRRTRIIESQSLGRPGSRSFLVESEGYVSPVSEEYIGPARSTYLFEDGKLTRRGDNEHLHYWLTRSPEEVALRHAMEGWHGSPLEVLDVNIRGLGELTATVKDRATARRYRLTVSKFYPNTLEDLD